MTTIYAVRHSLNENPDRICPGRMPGFHLSEVGEKRAEKTGKFLKDKAVDFIYTSPLERAFETANIISDFLPKAKIIHAYELTETNAIQWQAFKYEDLYKNRYHELYLHEPDTNEVPENLSKLSRRMLRFAQDLCEKYENKEVIIVTHEDPILALTLTLEGKSLKLVKSYDVAMGSVTTLVLNENCQLVRSSYAEPGKG